MGPTSELFIHIYYDYQQYAVFNSDSSSSLTFMYMRMLQLVYKLWSISYLRI